MNKKRSNEVLSELPALNPKLAYRLLWERDTERAERATHISAVKSTRKIGSTITGLVEGNHRPFYKCSIELAPQSNDTTNKSESPAAKKRSNVKTTTRKAKKSDFSSYISDYSCNCPDWGDPCKHVGALLLCFAKHPDRFQEVPSISSLLKGCKKSDLEELILSLSETSKVRDQIYTYFGYISDGDEDDFNESDSEDESEERDSYY
eukprot:TRINITY_DN1762_c0_g3_i1.p1 TRINITY_DN1762_c0_g3~~TRINITY_DN1762_c0_g3_i1.p1  ORF type:complete len:206 (-),score=34.78 TRINITY_DN1762_c0_g3_i1:107-724(-)